jgi:glucokinase
MNDLAGSPAYGPGAVVALDVGGTRIKAAVITPDGSRLVERRYPTGRADGPAAVLRRVVNIAAEMAAAGADATILACGIGSCGTVDLEGRVTSVNIGWERARIGDVIGDRLGLPVAVLNDVRAGALGEGGFGAARGETDYVYVALGTGIGAAIVSGGRVLPGAHGHAGELGHISVRQPGRLCACGARGCLETLMSAVGLEARWLETHGHPLPARRIIDRVLEGEPAATALWAESVEALAAGLLTLMSLVDPATIVLGGGLSSAGPRLIEPLAAALRAGARPFHADPDLRLAVLGDWSACAGAAIAARTLSIQG